MTRSHKLTPAQSRSFALILDGMKATEIARENGISLRTVQDQLGVVRETLGARTMAQAGYLAGLEVHAAKAPKPALDCRLCAFFTTQTGGCTSVVRCVNGARYAQTGPIQYWTRVSTDAAERGEK